MKIRSEIRAGRTFEQCAQERDWWKRQATLMEEYANSKKTTPPAGLWFPTTVTQLPSTPPTYPVYPTRPPTTGSGAYYPDMSGVCR
jgi:hypothetical protein